MGRQDYNYLIQDDFTGGINQDIRTARPNQVIDARNVWAPDGIVQCRPGYQGVITTQNSIVEGMSGEGGFFENTAVTPSTFSATATANFRQVNDRFYFYHSEPYGSLRMDLTASNTALTKLKAQYWNGSRWAYLPTTWVAAIDSANTYVWAAEQYIASGVALEDNTYWLFCPPNDWAETTVDGTTGYFIRGILLDIDINANVGFGSSSRSHDDNVTLVAMISAQFQAAKRFLCYHIRNDLSVVLDTNIIESYNAMPPTSTLLWNKVDSREILALERASWAVIPEFNELYITYNYDVTCHKAFPTVDDDIVAKVEDRAEYVGSVAGIKSPYHPDYIAQLGSFPKAKYLLWFQNQLWAFNLKENGKAFRWSAASDAATIGYRIWPEESYGVLADADMSQITGVATWNEHIVTFTNDALWRIVLIGASDIDLNVYTAVKITGETGCVSHSSIQNTPAGLIFLSEDGFYLYDGVRTRKISKEVDQTLRRINPSKRAFAASVHWKSKSVYMCSVADAGSDHNNLVFVYDYKHGACWLWDNIDAQCWAVDEDQYDNEHVYFGDHRGRIYEFGVGPTDWGTSIEHWFRTHRLGMFGRTSAKQFREVYVTATNEVSDITVKVIRQDEDVPESYTLNFDDDAEVPIDAFTFNSSEFAKKKYRSRRLAVRKNGDWAQIEVLANTANQPLKVTEVGLGYVQQGRR